MKQLIPLFAAAAAVIGVIASQAPTASAVTTVGCNFPAPTGTFKNCQFSGVGNVSGIATLDSTKTKWDYAANLFVGNRGSVVLQNATGTTVVDTSGRLCPEAVDATREGSPGPSGKCTTARQGTSGAPVRIRVFIQG
jgi:hypothetical protein